MLVFFLLMRTWLKAITLVGTLVSSGVLCAQCRFKSTTKDHALTYRFIPDFAQGGLVLHISFEFDSNSSGIQTLEIPTEWAGEPLHAVSNLHPISVGVVIVDGPDAGTKILHSPPNRPVIIEYDLRKDFPGPLVHPMQFHPVLMQDYFEFTGSNALVAPKFEPGVRETVNFDWQELPAPWAVATSFGTTTSASGRCQTYSGPWTDVDDGLYTAGIFRIHQFQIGRRSAVLAIRGDWTFTDDEATQQIARVIGSVRSFWHDDDFPYFLVTLKPYDRDHGSSDGSAFTNAFWMYVSRLDPLKQLLPQLAHESFHAWDPKKMGLVESDADENSIKWFGEGPTEYYAQLLTFKAGELSPSDYVSSLNGDLRKYPVSNSEYVRGRIIALWLDATIRQESDGKHSLDDVMYDMVRGRNKPLTLPRIFETSSRYLSASSLSMLRKAVTEHGDLAAPTKIPSVKFCAHPVKEDIDTFDLGLDLPHSTATGIVTGVIPDSPAYLAGLRDGQRLDGRLDVDNGNPDRLALFTITSDGGDKEIKFYPRGQTISVWQYRLDEDNFCH